MIKVASVPIPFGSLFAPPPTPGPFDPLRILSLSTQAHQHRFWADSLSGHRGHDDASSISEEGQELHYAFLRFHKPKPQQQEGTNTEYSEIKVHK